MDSYGRLCWGLVMVDGVMVYYEQTMGSGFRAHEFGVAGPWHEVNDSINRQVWLAIQADQKHNHRSE